ncbi:DUF2127 domain-containing protein [Candidatus Gottesmanbacteria bacterium]|nr:DUF2127 domain-containing protein [Candidatus Gottesmanbacteria bacterium]
MNTQGLEKGYHVSFYIIIYKFILGVIELLLGLGIVSFGNQIFTVYQTFKSQELLEDPHDLLISLAEKILPYILEHKIYIILLLIIIGLIKIIGAIGLYYRKHWGLDLLVGITVLFLPFDVYNILIHPTLAKFIYLLVNIFIALFLVNFKPKEYILKIKSRVRR